MHTRLEAGFGRWWSAAVTGRTHARRREEEGGGVQPTAAAASGHLACVCDPPVANSARRPTCCPSRRQWPWPCEDIDRLCGGDAPRPPPPANLRHRGVNGGRAEIPQDVVPETATTRWAGVTAGGGNGPSGSAAPWARASCAHGGHLPPSILGWTHAFVSTLDSPTGRYHASAR
jgi:hypothetical protein